MYYEFYGFERPPFNLTPDPQFLFLSSRHRDALASLEYGVASRKGFTVLTGEIGAGKTTLCRTLLRRLGQETRIALVLNSYLSDVELLQTINDEFGVSSASDSKKKLIDELNVFLLSENAAGRDCLVVIDEAQNLAPETLEQVRMLSNLETETDKLIQILLMGQPELRDTLRLPRLEQLNQRVTVRHHLEPLDREETETYVKHRLEVAQGPDAKKIEFASAGLDRIYKFSRGVPRKINLVADRSLLAGYAAEARVISGDLVEKAIEEVAGDEGMEPAAASAGGGGVESVAMGSASGGGGTASAVMAAPAPAALQAAYYPSGGYAPQPYPAPYAHQFAPQGYPYQAPAPAPAAPPASSPLKGAMLGLLVAGLAILIAVGGVLGTLYSMGWRPSQGAQGIAAALSAGSAKPTPSPAPASTPAPSATPAASPAPSPAPAAAQATPTPSPTPTPAPTPTPRPKAWSIDADGLPRVNDPAHSLAAAQLGLVSLYFDGVRVEADKFAAKLATMPPQALESFDIASIGAFRANGLVSARIELPLSRLIALGDPLLIQAKPSKELDLGPWLLVPPGQNPKGLSVRVGDPLRGFRKAPREELEKICVASRVFFFDSNGLASLKLGDEGPEVALLQAQLSRAGAWPVHGDAPDGKYSLDTREAVAAIQSRHGLAGTGESLDGATLFYLRSHEKLAAAASGGKPLPPPENLGEIVLEGPAAPTPPPAPSRTAPSDVDAPKPQPSGPRLLDEPAQPAPAPAKASALDWPPSPGEPGATRPAPKPTPKAPPKPMEWVAPTPAPTPSPKPMEWNAPAAAPDSAETSEP